MVDLYNKKKYPNLRSLCSKDPIKLAYNIKSHLLLCLSGGYAALFIAVALPPVAYNIAFSNLNDILFNSNYLLKNINLLRYCSKLIQNIQEIKILLFFNLIINFSFYFLFQLLIILFHLIFNFLNFLNINFTIISSFLQIIFYLY